MLKEESIALANYRIEKAKDCLKAAKILLDEECYSDSANRSYYAIFHSINAINALYSIGFKKHSGVISNFNQNYIKTHIIEKEYGKIANTAFDVRKDNDYSDFYVAPKNEVSEQYENAVKFVNRIERFIMDEIKKASDK
ncbi:MAG: HEPN domain-containing protein [Ruminococcus sp.]|nr:HEPN domain-containing protein [Ruminococcus sp.]